MTDYEFISAVAAMVSAVAAVAGFTGLMWQLRHAERSEERERKRVRQQATLELVMEKFFEVRELREKLRLVLRHDVDPAAVDRQIAESDDAKRNTHEAGAAEYLADQVRRYLTYLEFLAIGVESGILDRDIVKEMSGRHFRTVYRSLRAYIKRVRKREAKGPYSGFEDLVWGWYPEEKLESARHVESPPLASAEIEGGKGGQPLAADAAERLNRWVEGSK